MSYNPRQRQNKPINITWALPSQPSIIVHGNVFINGLKANFLPSSYPISSTNNNRVLNTAIERPVTPILADRKIDDRFSEKQNVIAERLTLASLHLDNAKCYKGVGKRPSGRYIDEQAKASFLFNEIAVRYEKDFKFEQAALYWHKAAVCYRAVAKAINFYNILYKPNWLRRAGYCFNAEAKLTNDQHAWEAAEKCFTELAKCTDLKGDWRRANYCKSRLLERQQSNNTFDYRPQRNIDNQTYFQLSSNQLSKNPNRFLNDRTKNDNCYRGRRNNPPNNRSHDNVSEPTTTMTR